jgi:tetratricopeptide (TPR) repeat protein
MRTRVWKSIAYLVFILLVVASANLAEAQVAPIRGKIVDEEGAPLSGVEIVVTSSTSPDAIKGRTKKKGTFTIVLPNRSWEYDFRFTLDGYQELEIPIEAMAAMNEVLEITLARTQDIPASTEPQAETAEIPPEAPPQAPADQKMTQQRRAAILLFNEGVTALEVGDRETAETTFRRATVVDPGFSEPYRALMAIAAETENWKAAASDAQALLRIEPDDLDARWTLYYALLRVGDAESIASAARSLAAVDPESAAELVSNAQSLFDLDEVKITRVLLEIAIEVAPDQVDAYFVLGMSCNSLGDTEAAKTALTKFLEVAPMDHTEVESARSMLDYLR